MTHGTTYPVEDRNGKSGWFISFMKKQNVIDKSIVFKKGRKENGRNQAP